MLFYIHHKITYGIPKLNKLLLENENTELIKINLHELSGKTIAIDTSIYLYKFSAQERSLKTFTY